jgi:hypothetical protein
MINRKQIKIHIALIIILLQISQFAALTHAVEHPFHAQDKSCQIFLQCEKSGNGLITHFLQFFALTTHTQVANKIASIWLTLPQTTYSARAPPSLS